MKNMYILTGYKFFCKSATSILFVVIMLISKMSIAQVATDGDYRTRGSGNWSGAGTWQVRAASLWSNTSIAPTASNNIYIQSNHTLTIDVATADCKDLHINSLSGSTGIVSIGSNTLQVSGKLRAYTGTVVTTGADGTFYSSQGSSSSPLDAMLSTTGSGVLKFIGATRNITNTGEWSNTGGINHATEFALNAGATGTCQTGYKSSGILISSGTIDMTSGISRLAPDNGTVGQGDCTIQSGATLISANSGSAGTSVMSRTGTAASGRAGTLNLNGKLILSGLSPEIQFTTVNIGSSSTIEYSRAGGQSFVTSTFTGAAAIGSIYANVIFSGSGSKTAAGNFSVSKDLTISGSAVLPLSALSITVGGNWTNYNSTGLTESTSTIDFNGTGTQSINTTGGEDFFKVKKSGSGTLTLNSDARFAGTSSDLNISAGILDAGTNTLSGTASSSLTISGGTLKLAKLATILPEFSITPYNITGGTIELNGAGTQTLRGTRDYQNLTFSTSGTKGISSTISNITGTVTVADAAILDVSNNTMGGTGTNLTMTGTSVYKTAGTSTKPDALGTYSLGTGTTVEFTNAALTLESIRLAPTYYNITVSGTSVGTTTLVSGIKFQSGGTFTVRNAGIFKQANSNGFSGAANTSIDNTNNPIIVLESGSTIEYNGSDQPITNQTINTPSNANYDGLTLSGTGIKTAPATTLTIKGNLTKSGSSSFAHNNGTVILNGSVSQAYNAVSPVMDFYDLSINNTVDLTINNDLTVAKELAFGANAKLNLGTGNITLNSNAGNTANVAIIPPTAVITYNSTGRFIVERYIPSGISHPKSWQFLSAPTVGQTIKESWMENGLITSIPNGYGTWITGPGAGFDVSSSTPSMKTYIAGTNLWTAVGNPVSAGINNSKGYMIFVRGDRSVYNFSGANSTAVPTTLRTKGSLLTGDQPGIAVTAGQFESIGNPYASAIDFSTVDRTGGVDPNFYLWDPTLVGSFGLGAYQTITAATSYQATPGNVGGSTIYNTTSDYRNIQSGQAFFVQATASSGNVNLKESAKTSGSALVNRGTGIPASSKSMLSTNLFTAAGTTSLLADGNRIVFDRIYSNTVNGDDAIKMANSGENFGIIKNGKILAVEARKPVIKTDTIHYIFSNLRRQAYRLCFVPENMAIPGLEAVLIDRFLNSRIPVSLSDTGFYNFNISTDAASAMPGRFILVFKQKQEAENKGSKETAQIKNTLSVYPNPVEDKTIRIVFKDQRGGKYSIQLISQSGQPVLGRTINVSANYFTTTLRVPNIAAGNYQLAVTAADGNMTILYLIIK